MLYTIQFSELKDTIPHVSDAKMYLVCADESEAQRIALLNIFEIISKKIQNKLFKAEIY